MSGSLRLSKVLKYLPKKDDMPAQVSAYERYRQAIANKGGSAPSQDPGDDTPDAEQLAAIGISPEQRAAALDSYRERFDDAPIDIMKLKHLIMLSGLGGQSGAAVSQSEIEALQSQLPEKKGR